MPDIGVLSLQIHSESTQAEHSLRRLEGALLAIKAATASTGLNKVASALERINKAFNIQTVVNMNGLAAALQKIQAACDFTVPNLNGLNRMRSVMESMSRSSETVRQTQETVEGIGSGFAKASSEVRDVVNGMNELSATMNKVSKTSFMDNGFDDKFSDFMRMYSEWNKMQSQHTLGAGTTSEFEELKKNAIEVEGTVSDVIENVQRLGESSSEGLLKLGTSATGIISYAENLNNQWENISKNISEAAQRQKEEYVRACEESIEKARELSREIGGKYDQKRYRDPTDITQNTKFAAALRGDQGEAMRFSAIRAEASHTGETFDEVARRIEMAMVPINKVREQIKEIFSELEKTPKINWSEGIDRQMNIGGPFKDAADSAKVFTENATETQRQIEGLLNYLNRPIKMNYADAINQLQGINSEAKSAQDSMAAFMELMANDESPIADTIREANPELNQMSQELKEQGQVISGETIPKLVDLDGELKSKKDDAEEAASGFKKFTEKLKDMKKHVKAMFPHLTTLGKQFVSIARRMAIRAVIKQITSGFREGVENVYHYSKAIDGSFSKSMDNAASSLLQMKNSIGAAAAPAIQALIPVLQSVVSWFTTLINYVNQFFALMRGQSTWTRALATSTEAYAESASKAGGAANDWLADFDELNVIPSGGGGGGGGAGMPDYASMFEEVTEFDNKIKEIVEWIQEHMELIKLAAIATGAAILAWKFSQGFLSEMSGLRSLSLAAGVALSIIGLKIGYDAGFEIGYTNSNDALLKAVGGALATTAGGALIGGALGGGAGAAVGAVAGLTVGILIEAVGYLNGVSLRQSEARGQRVRAEWGGRSYTTDQLREHIQSMFDMEINPVITLLDPYVQTASDALQQLTQSTSQLRSMAQTRAREVALNIPITVSTDDLVQMANQVIQNINDHQAATLELLQVTMSVSSITGPNGQALDAESLLSTIMIGEQTATEYMAQLGENMRLAYEGALIPDIGQTAEDLAQAYASEMLYITTRAQQIFEEEKIKFEIDAEFDFSNMDLDSAREMIRMQEAEWDATKNEFIDQRKQTIFSIMKRKSSDEVILEKMREKNQNGEYDTKIQEVEATIAAYDEIIAGLKNWDADWEKLITPTRNKMMAEWAKLKERQYGYKEFTADDYLNAFNQNRTELDEARANNDVEQMMEMKTGLREWFDNTLLGAVVNSFRDADPTNGAAYEYDMSNLMFIDPKERYKLIDQFKAINLTDQDILEYLYMMGETETSIKFALSEYEETNQAREKLLEVAQKAIQEYGEAGTYTQEQIAQKVREALEQEGAVLGIGQWLPTWIIDEVESQLDYSVNNGNNVSDAFDELDRDVAEAIADLLTSPDLDYRASSLEEAAERAKGWYNEELVDKVIDYIYNNGKNKFLEELGIELEGDTHGMTNGSRVIAFAAPQESGGGYGGFNTNPMVDTSHAFIPKTDTQADVANGTREGTADISAQLSIVQGLLRGILSNTANSGKVAVVPTSALGRSVAAGAALFANVTGND